MIIIALSILASSIPQSLLNSADDAAGAYVSCLYGVARSAGTERVSVEDYRRALSNACLAQKAALQRIEAEIFSRRGVRDPQATAKATTQQTVESMVEQYRRLPQIEQQLRQLQPMIAACKAHPERCH